jgi:hypothetical protein
MKEKTPDLAKQKRQERVDTHTRKKEEKKKLPPKPKEQPKRHLGRKPA